MSKHLPTFELLYECWEEEPWLAAFFFAFVFFLLVLIVVLFSTVYVDLRYTGPNNSGELWETPAQVHSAVITDIQRDGNWTRIYLKDGRVIQIHGDRGHTVTIDGEYKKVENDH
jgi:hypothetical protein